MPGLDEIQPWDCQPGETAKAYQAFVTYRDIGPARSVRKVAESLGKSETLISGWSSKHHWVSRTAAWDSMPSRVMQEAYEEMAARIAAQHERVASKLMAKLEANVDLLTEGQDPSMRFSTAMGAARQSHQFATELVKPTDTTKTEITSAIEKLINRLAGEE
jgi:hypothetical protein